MKVVGKIDLGSINQSTRPKRKSKEERRAEREAKAAPKSQSRHVRHRNRTNEDNVVFFHYQITTAVPLVATMSIEPLAPIMVSPVTIPLYSRMV